MCLINTFIFGGMSAQEVPFVYNIENTGAVCPTPVLPNINELPVIEPLTDPFEWSDRSGRDTTFESWSCRRAEIKAEVENYEIGIKPDRPDSITASYENGVLTVNVTVGENTLTLTSAITLPEGEGPFPAIIGAGFGFGSGSLPSDIFTSRNIAIIPYTHNQVATYGSKLQSDPYYKLYPDLFYAGQYSSWAWGVSRIIDGLELVQDSLPIDLSHLAVTGCSYAGKLALFAGALDERIALTIAQESGGGGAAAWRVSETLTGVETLGNTDRKWFISNMFQFAGKNVSKLPHDHHELMSMVAPRALLVFGNPDYVWLADESGYVSCRAAQRVWENFGIPERFGFVIEGGHSHCALSSNQRVATEAFVDRFLLDDKTANTDIHINTYPDVDFARWTYWWGKDEAAFPSRDWQGTESIWFEAECGTVGENWIVMDYPIASNASVVAVKTGLSNNSAETIDEASSINLPFTTTKDTAFHFFARLYCPKTNGSAFWIKLDDGSFKKYAGLTTSGMQWKKLFTTNQLSPGDHTLTIAFTAEGAKLDKICISSLKNIPAEEGETAANKCEPPITPVGINEMTEKDGFKLWQNYPNPVNGKTTISFIIPKQTHVSLKVFNLQGAEIAELAGKKYQQGNHEIVFDSVKFPDGIYFYTFSADAFSATRKMILKNK
ncbi:MAG: T9SS type A sorting domain-containing protein [Prolixibacteraceae bacterium]|nr:T9SS type A sorting domain-containing protein [Prolixibacteraceae bacterium]